MKQGLQLSQGLQQNLAPQLQQAIRLLQFSALELTQEIQRLMETNPLLEYEEPNQEEDNEIQQTPVTAMSEPQRILGEGNASRSSADDLPGIENVTTANQTLSDYLLWQINLVSLSDTDHAVAVALIDAINEDGYLKSTCEDIHVALQQQGVDVTTTQVESVLKQIQCFDPTGVGARNIQECLLLQLDALMPQPPEYALATLLLKENSHCLGRLNALQLARKLKQTPEQVKQALKCIQSLNPRPGSIIGNAQVDYIIPDVVCDRRYGQWSVHLNEAISPHIGLNKQYVSLMRGSTNARDNVFMRDNLREARWFLKSLENRNTTLLRVAQCIVERQHAFLERGEEAMVPMILQDVASQLGVHESTVSRVTTHKYMYTQRGIFELKYFFSSHVKNQTGQQCSSTAIRAHIKGYLNDEVSDKPMSDNQIAQRLERDHKITVARRTITKYREAMGVPSSNERRFAPIKG